MSYVQPCPDWRVTLDGQDLTSKLRPRLKQLRLTDKRDGEADELEIVLDDSDGRLALPKPDQVLHVQLGWLQGTGVTVGLVDKGSYKVDEVGHSGPPAEVTLRARSADFAAPIGNRREFSWHHTTLGAIVADLAARNGLKASCAPSLASIAVTVAAQSRESDLAFLRRLGRAHDAVATVKKGVMILSPMAKGSTAGGAPIPAATIARSTGDRHSYNYDCRQEADGVVAVYHDRGSASRQAVTVGKAADARRIARVYATKKGAQRAAETALARAQRLVAKLTFNLALGRPDLYPERTVAVSGFKPEIDAISWLIVEVEHVLDDQGLRASLQMEAQPK